MPNGNRRWPSLPSTIRAIAGLLVAALAVAGCSQRHVTDAQPIKIASAFVMQASGVDEVAAYMVIANRGSADQLVRVSSSAGGKVVMFGPGGPGLAAARTLSWLGIPAHSLTRLDPTGMHLEIVRPGRLRDGTDITLTLVFAHAGTMRVQAQVSNPTVNDGGYLGP
jgi:copper(I)-binding protein